MTRQIELTNNYFTLIDDNLFDYYNQWNWYAHEAVDGYVYATRSENSKSIMLHREVMNATENVFVDHIDGNHLNNQLYNLRFASYSQNAMNRKGKNSNNKSGYRNVSFMRGFYRVQLQINGKNHLFPEKFDDPEEAGIFAKQLRLEYYGEFAGK